MIKRTHRDAVDLRSDERDRANVFLQRKYVIMIFEENYAVCVCLCQNHLRSWGADRSQIICVRIGI